MKTSQKGFIGIILIIIAALAIGAGATYYITKEKKSNETPAESTITTSANNDVDVQIDDQKQNPPVTADVKAEVRVPVTVTSSQLQISKGVYGYVELAGSGSSAQTWVYKLNIVKEGGLGNLTLNIDGFQAMTRINAVGRLSKGSIEVVFDSYAPNNMFTPYTKGDVLFTLKPTNAGLAFEWKKMQPYLPLNVGGGYFVQR